MIDLSPYDFADFGCSVGGSMALAAKIFDGGPAIGIDINPAKVEQTRAAGHHAVVADATRPKLFKGTVRFSMLSHFLEHLPDYKTVARAIRTAVTISDEFVFIRQPWFDSDGELFRHGLKFYWSDWHGHPMTMTSLQMYRCVRKHLESGTLARATILGHQPISGSDSDCVLPLSAPLDSKSYDAAVHGPKASVEFAVPAYKELVAVLIKRDANQLDTLLTRFPTAVPLFDERTQSSGEDTALAVGASA